MAKRHNPAAQDSARAELRRELEADHGPISYGVVPIAPGDARSIFALLKTFRAKFPAHAEALVERIGRMLGASQEEMAAGMTLRPRNDWVPKPTSRSSSGGSGMHSGLNAGSLGDAPAMMAGEAPDVGRLARRVLPEEMRPEELAKLPPQGPNATRAARAPIVAAEKIVTKVEAAIKHAPKE